MNVREFINNHQISTLEMFILANPEQQRNFCFKHNIPLFNPFELDELLQTTTALTYSHHFRLAQVGDSKSKSF